MIESVKLEGVNQVFTTMGQEIITSAIIVVHPRQLNSRI
jgi:hypothetical protein